ncbi:diguanylate cyclase [Acidisoma silvae]|uniref:diguanylate cyclase n=1 Tax=Acidisoma silvae TaxID=2802396 RepID=A0A963YQQ0_9PROT|nr:diguanylate cyclase [Acidisoma silvae]MCB8875061.1 diguanylate cyclase [Acidisoma silvae]
MFARLSVSLERRLTLTYLLALAIVAGLTLVSHIVLMRVLVTQSGAAAIISLSDRQPMLSQRIASLAAQYADGDLAIRPLLVQTIDQFAQQHDELLRGDRAFGLMAPRLGDLHALYFSGDNPVHGMVERYVADARQVAALPPGSPTLKPLLADLFAAADGPLVLGLGEVVQAHQRRSDQQLAELADMQDVTLLVILMTLLMEALTIFRPMVRYVSGYARQLLTLATVDPLTDVLNRRAFMDQGAQALARARTAAAPVSVLMVDADHFKRINDTYGHAGGDAVLKALAAALQAEIADPGLIGRYGGEEFVLLLPDMAVAAAWALAERLRAAVLRMTAESEGRPMSVSISIGLASAAAGDEGLDRLLPRADQALYRAKANGRNRVEVAE